VSLLSQATQPEQSSNSNGRDIIGEAFLNTKLPASVIFLLRSACSNGTWSQYSTHIKRWSEFCEKKVINIWSPSINDVLTFLAEEFESGRSYSSVNTMRSALSTLLLPIEGFKIGEHPLVVRLLKGVSKLRPPMPRYKSTWDVSLVLRLFESWSDNTTMSLKLLSLKLVGLFALVTAQRVQALSSITIDNIHFSDPVQILIPNILKTTSISNPNRPIILPKYGHSEKLCPVSTLSVYIERTKLLRNTNQLVISYVAPHGGVSSQRISKWLCELLRLAGIDTNLFKGHSYRHASTSRANAKGVCIDTIYKSAGWSEKSKVFAKFYDKPVESQSEFANAILSSSK